MSSPTTTLTRRELAHELAPLARTPVDYGAHPPRGPYPGEVLPDLEAVESQDTGPQGAIVRRLRAKVAGLEEDLREARAELARRCATP